MLNGELEKECKLRLGEDGEFKNKLEKMIVQVMKEKLRKVKRQTGDRKVGRKESKIPYMIEHMTYDGHRNGIKIKPFTIH